jgi:hypothetical protein
LIELMDHQQDAINNLSNGNILWGGVGSGKSATVLGYYMKNEAPRDIVVITTAKKRDSLDWEAEAARFGISTEKELSLAGSLTVDSWNNIKKYQNDYGKFFIFDEQRVVGTGSWTKSFLKIANKNHWLLLSATPGDTWLDYGPVFVANRYFTSISDFKRQHVVYVPFIRYPKVDRYIGEATLERLRNQVLVEMPYENDTVREVNYLEVGFDKDKFDKVWKRRWNVFDDRPVRDVAELFRLMRKVVNMDPSRLEMVHWLLGIHDRLIIFYNFDYELGLLRSSLYGIADLEVGEWNGHLKTSVPTSDRWVYLVQYAAGAEAWECTSTNAMVFYSMTYSYKNFEQSMGRIDRLGTPFKILYYYVFYTNSIIDRAIKRSLALKKTFNERKFMAQQERESMTNL